MVNLPDEYNSFVDRDMFMRHLGGGIGHQTAQQNNMHAEEMDMDIDIDEVEEGSVHDEGNYSGQPDRGTSGKFDEEDGKDEVRSAKYETPRTSSFVLRTFCFIRSADEAIQRQQVE